MSDVSSVSRDRVRELVDAGGQLVEVVEARPYRLAHAPGSCHAGRGWALLDGHWRDTP